MTGYSYLQALEASTEYFNGDDLASKVFVDKYPLKNEKEEYLEATPTDMHHRLAKEIARVEAKYPNPMSEEEIFGLLDHFEYVVLQGSPMSAIGNPYKLQSCGNCFVIESPWDSYGGILKADQELVQLMKRRAGCGLDLSNIRPRGMPTDNAAGTTDGLGIFMERFSNTCREVAQGGRRGAEMQSLAIEHPEVETFITIKQDKTKVTGANVSVRISDEFMRAVKNDDDFLLRWPVDAEKPLLTKTIRAKELWNKIIHCAWAKAEPGVFFWTNVIKNSPADIYAQVNPLFKTISSNPCFAGDTLIAVADGRNAVSIKELAAEDKDVPVYSVDADGKVSIKMGRHPRITGTGKSLVRVHLDDGTYVDTTPDHKFLLLDDQEVEAQSLKSGDSLPRFTKALEPVKTGGKDYYRVYCDTRNSNEDKLFEHRLIARFYHPEEWDRVYTAAKVNGFANTGGLVVHHKDYNSLNNSPNNLQIMTFKEHTELHASIDTVGEKNGRFSGFSHQEIRNHALILTQKLGQRFSMSEWQEYAKGLGLPQTFSGFRRQVLGTVLDLAKSCAIELGIEYVNADPRVVKTLQSMIDQGYDAKIVDDKVYVTKACEMCGADFQIDHDHREFAFCSRQCSAAYVNTDRFVNERRVVGINDFFKDQAVEKKNQQARIYSELKFELGRDPQLKEWEAACTDRGIPHRVGRRLKHSFKNYGEVKEAGETYNHKVIRVEELPGEHIVYNITVDDNHTIGVVTGSSEKRGNKWFSGIFTRQCGEIVMGVDSCRLTVVNLFSFVNSPFRSSARFDYELFETVVIKAQRIMDDIVDLELEQIDKIIVKIKKDPEPIEVKRVELDLWTRFRKTCEQGRRTGLGITALGDCLAALGIKYGSEKSIKKTEKIYQALAIGAYKSSCIMAGERGPFPLFDAKLEADHPFITRILSADEELLKLYTKHGRRNIALTTTAPTGSVSTLTQTSSGIEPVFLLSYVRRKKINPSDKDAKIDFTDAMGDKWQEFTVYHHGVKKWMEVTGETDITKSPYWGATSNDIDWVASVEMQAAAQRWICHSISKTCNLPKDATEELVAKVYMKAWESGCKGFTIYRDGCRDGVLLSKEESEKSAGARPQGIALAHAPKRPIELPCEIKKVKVQGEAWTIFMGMLQNKPYEIFGGLSSYIDIPNKFKVGKIVKNGKVDNIATYNLFLGEGEDEMVIKDLVKVFDNPNFGTFTRTISLALRHGAPVQYIVEQLQKDKHSDMTSFSKVIARVLKAYISDGTQATSDKTCNSCKQTGSIVYQEGCLICKGCGASRCN